MASPHGRHLLDRDFRIRIGHGEDDRIGRHQLDHVLGHGALRRKAEEHVGIDQRLAKRARRGLHRIARFPLVHALGAAAIDHALGIAEDQILGVKADRAQEFETGDPGGAGAVADDPGRLDVASGEVERIKEAGSRNDCSAVLIVVEYRDVEQFAQPLLDHEAFRRLDVLQVDAAPAFAEEFYAIDEFVRVLGRHFEIDRINVGEAFEQDRFAFHDRLGGERAAIAEPEDSGAVGDHRDKIALGGVVEGAVLVFGDGEHRDGDTRRIGQREVALRRHRLGGDDFELSGPSLAVKQQRFLVREGRTDSAAGRLVLHCNSLPPREDDVVWRGKLAIGPHPLKGRTPHYFALRRCGHASAMTAVSERRV